VSTLKESHKTEKREGLPNIKNEGEGVDPNSGQPEKEETSDKDKDHEHKNEVVELNKRNSAIAESA
jgi:hypothetical protein